MRRPLVIAAIVAGFVLLLISYQVVRILNAAGTFTGIRTVNAEGCGAVPAPAGPEDLVIDREQGIAYISATDRRAVTAGRPDFEGGLYTLDLNASPDDWRVEALALDEPPGFAPHGLDLLVTEDGRRFLFVIDHPGGAGDAVHIVELTDGRAGRIVETITNPLFANANDIAAAGADPFRFYLSNDHGRQTPLGQQVETYFFLDEAAVTYWNGASARRAAGDLTFANGVALAPGGETLYVAETTDRALRVYDVDRETGALRQADYVFLGTGVDNIDIAPDGAILIGAHPKLLDFAAHAGDENERSPSQALELRRSEGGGGTARTLYLDDGGAFSGSSVAARHGDLVIMGAVFDPVLFVCPYPEDPNAAPAQG